ncbi:MAG: hypothetical protein JW806_04180 [Sedimentisphaerales bacterium]|nr:hypothetical protein [Sedimentisphaerales bacterium]
MGENSKEKSVNLLWKILPFVITASAVCYLLTFETTDKVYFYTFVALVAVILWPFSVAVICMIRAIILAKILGVSLNAKTTEPRLRKFGQRAEKWMAITLFNALAAFLIISLMAVNFVKAERKERPLEIIKSNQPIRLSEGSEIDKDLNTFDKIMRHLWKISLTAIAIAIVLVLVLIVLKKVPLERPDTATKVVMFIAGSMFVVPIIAGFMISGIMEKMVLREVRIFLNNASEAAEVIVDGKDVEGDERIIKELAAIAPMNAHNSRETKKFRVEVKDTDQSLTIYLARDSEYMREYWIFYPGYRYTSVNEIGRIRTNLFDDH